jgi:hypothetical protein
MVWRASCRARVSGASGGVEVGEECLVLLVGLERVDGRGQVLRRRDRPDALSAGKFFGGHEVVLRPALGLLRRAAHVTTFVRFIAPTPRRPVLLPRPAAMPDMVSGSPEGGSAQATASKPVTREPSPNQTAAPSSCQSQHRQAQPRVSARAVVAAQNRVAMTSCASRVCTQAGHLTILASAGPGTVSCISGAALVAVIFPFSLFSRGSLLKGQHGSPGLTASLSGPPDADTAARRPLGTTRTRSTASASLCGHSRRCGDQPGDPVRVRPLPARAGGAENAHPVPSPAIGVAGGRLGPLQD